MEGALRARRDSPTNSLPPRPHGPCRSQSKYGNMDFVRWTTKAQTRRVPRLNSSKKSALRLDTLHGSKRRHTSSRQWKVFVDNYLDGATKCRTCTRASQRPRLKNDTSRTACTLPAVEPQCKAATAFAPVRKATALYYWLHPLNDQLSKANGQHLVLPIARIAPNHLRYTSPKSRRRREATSQHKCRNISRMKTGDLQSVHAIKLRAYKAGDFRAA